jgi:hypothetical protein
MKLSKIPSTVQDSVIITKAVATVGTHFIFRGNGEEVTIKENANGTITTSHKLTFFEMDYLREYYPFLFKSKE